jgi:hypothetical protein
MGSTYNYLHTPAPRRHLCSNDKTTQPKGTTLYTGASSANGAI